MQTPVPATAPATAQGATSDGGSPITEIITLIMSPILSRFTDISFFSPAIFTLGSLFISCITLNYPIFLLSLASGEALLLQNVLKGVSGYLATAESSEAGRGLGGKKECKSKYEGSESTKFKYLLDNGMSTPFPNSSLYFLSFAAAYCIQSMSHFTEETQARGASYSSRPYMSYISAGMFIILFSIYSLFYSCDTPLGVILSVATGLLVGFVLCYQNYLLFGKAGVDLLFIPPLVSRSGMDYICVSTN